MTTLIIIAVSMAIGMAIGAIIALYLGRREIVNLSKELDTFTKLYNDKKCNCRK